MSLARRIAEFYGQGKEQRNGAGWLTNCPVHSEKKPSLSVTDNGEDDVKVYCHVGCSFKEIKDQFRADGLLPEWVPEYKGEKYEKRNGKKQKAADNNNEEKSEETLAKEAKEKESFVWKQADRDHADDIGRYLRAERSIPIQDIPICLRWGTYTDKESGDIVSMIVAAASKPTDKRVYAVQRLFIDDEGKKSGAKMLGNCEGRGVWFDRKGDLSEIIVGEGIETVLSAMYATGKNGVAALSTSGLKALIFPEETNTIYLAVDSDPVRDREQSSMPGQKAAIATAETFESSRSGRIAHIVSPDDTCFSDAPNKIDFNDLLKEDQTGESIRVRFELAIPFKNLEWSPTQDEKKTHKESGKSSPHNDQAAIDEMFNRFVFLASENKVIDTLGHDIKDSLMVERAFVVSQAGTEYFYYDKNDNLTSMPLAKHWLLSDDKKVASSTRYSPGDDLLFKNGCGRTYYNSFRFPYQNDKQLNRSEREKCLGNWHKIMGTVFHKHASYIEDWLSFSIQHPQKRTGIMPVCFSNVGLGKSLIMAAVSRVVGHQNFSNGKILDVTGLGKSGAQWGDWIFNKKISCIEEIFPEGEPGISYQIIDALKDIITNETLNLNLKGGKNGTVRVYSNIIGFSNHKNCMKIPLEDRRLFVVDSSDQKLLSKAEYRELWDWINEEMNMCAVFQYLRERDISGEFVPGQAKMTKAKRSMQIDSRSSMQTAFDLVIEQYPNDLLTSGELQLAVTQAMKYIDGDESEALSDQWNASKQYNAIMKTSTTLVADGKRIRLIRLDGQKTHPTTVRAIRNGQKWSSASVIEIKAAMFDTVPLNWIKEKEDDLNEAVPF